jgi:hypothetical protein
MAPARFKSVVFPHPLRPTSAVIVPGSSTSDTSRKASSFCPLVWYIFEARRNSRRGGFIDTDHYSGREIYDIA